MDSERILSKISELEKYIGELNQILPDSETEYTTSTKNRRATERILQISIECIIDICAIMVKELRLGPPSDEDDLLSLLFEKIPSIDKIRQMKSFRNLLVHQYAKIDNQLVYKIALEDPSDFQSFINEIKKLLLSI